MPVCVDLNSNSVKPGSANQVSGLLHEKPENGPNLTQE